MNQSEQIDASAITVILKQILARSTPVAPPVKLKTSEAMALTPYRSRKAFRDWATRHGIRPSDNGRLWARADIERALTRG